jgi:hypothetical protein
MERRESLNLPEMLREGTYWNPIVTQFSSCIHCCQDHLRTRQKCWSIIYVLIQTYTTCTEIQKCTTSIDPEMYRMQPLTSHQPSITAFHRCLQINHITVTYCCRRHACKESRREQLFESASRLDNALWPKGRRERAVYDCCSLYYEVLLLRSV